MPVPLRGITLRRNSFSGTTVGLAKQGISS
jgi:hypothetical protein